VLETCAMTYKASGSLTN